MNTTHLDPQHVSTAFETVGHFEYVTEKSTGRVLGTRDVTPERGRKCGYHGEREEVLTAPLTLKTGHKTTTYKASPAKPLVVRTVLQIKCGKLLRPINPIDCQRTVNTLNLHKHVK